MDTKVGNLLVFLRKKSDTFIFNYTLIGAIEGEVREQNLSSQLVYDCHTCRYSAVHAVSSFDSNISSSLSQSFHTQ